MYGLLEVHNPENATSDIVFVHGLHGDREKTWTKNSVFWPQKLLPLDITDARIFSYGYDANIAHFWARPADNRLDTYSNDLFSQLNNRRAETPAANRPLIFVAHSLGGLVVANAMVDSASNSYQSLSSCIRGIAFIGTPHKGSAKAKWAQVGRQIIAYFGKSTNPELAKDLEEKSEKLAKIGDVFPKLLKRRNEEAKGRIELVCFFEGQPMNIGMIVDESSATLSGYESILLNGNHSEICKFGSRDEENYTKVVGHLMKWTREFENSGTTEEAKKVTNDAYFYGTNNGLQQHTNSGTMTLNFGMRN
ncbi:uncharacterized protein PAC_02678 [Phialocephala subalpina]|uniref:DUF676 domain-containing protein n=1 Tax=Phialocephala subalpina TaxID=576137 RepID=A0A1L7WJ68_9HELO|nr:uncharacterized protein PAC_02678 [Phialocephala subalpina]